MNLAIRGIDANIRWGDSFHDDQFKDLKADFILANPPFNDSDWGGELLQAGWLEMNLSPEDARKRIYKLESPEQAVKEMNNWG